MITDSMILSAMRDRGLDFDDFESADDFATSLLDWDWPYAGGGPSRERLENYFEDQLENWYNDQP